MCGEADISHREDWDFNVLLATADLDEILEWADRHSQANDKSGAWQWSKRFALQPHQFVSLYAGELWSRLKHIDEDEKEIPIETFIGGFYAGRYEQIDATAYTRRKVKAL